MVREIGFGATSKVHEHLMVDLATSPFWIKSCLNEEVFHTDTNHTLVEKGYCCFVTIGKSCM